MRVITEPISGVPREAEARANTRVSTIHTRTFVMRWVWVAFALAMSVSRASIPFVGSFVNFPAIG